MNRNQISWKKKVIAGINLLYLLLVLLFVTDNFQLLEVKTAFLKNFVQFGVLISTPIILFVNLTFIRIRKWNILIGIGAFFVFGTLTIIISQRSFLWYLFSTSDWNTQTVIYENNRFFNKTIEFQMKDIGALGYQKRTVEVTYFTPWLMMTSELKTEPNSLIWRKVDRDVNEMEMREI